MDAQRDLGSLAFRTSCPWERLLATRWQPRPSVTKGISCFGEGRCVVSAHPLLNISCNSRLNAHSRIELTFGIHWEQACTWKEGRVRLPGPPGCAPRAGRGSWPLWSRAEVVGMLAPLLSRCVASGRSRTLSEPLFLLCAIWRGTRDSACCGAWRGRCLKAGLC